MSRNVKRALLAGLAGALQAADSHFKTQRAMEAERLKEERLAAIRAAERGEDRAFQREQTDRQIAAQEQRDERTIAAQTARDEREAERRMQELQVQGENQRRLMREQAAFRPPENTGYVEFIDAEGRPSVMSRSEFAALPPEQRAGVRFRGDTTTTVSPPAPPRQQAPAATLSRPETTAQQPEVWVRGPNGTLIPAPR